jgi:hypothetical protein
VSRAFPCPARTVHSASQRGSMRARLRAVSPRECSYCRLQREILTLFVVAFPAFLLFAGVVLGCVGLIFHETRPFKNQSTFAMDRETVEFARAQEAEAKIQADRAAKKKA